MNVLELLHMHLDDNNITNECMAYGGWRVAPMSSWEHVHVRGTWLPDPKPVCKIIKIKVYIKLASVGNNTGYMADMIDLTYNKAAGNIIGRIRKSDSYPRSIYDLLKGMITIDDCELQSLNVFFNITNPRSFDRISEWIAVVSSVACEIYNGELKRRGSLLHQGHALGLVERPFPSVKSFGEPGFFWSDGF